MGYFIRLTVHDRIGVFAAIAKRMADNDISLESIVQHAVSGETEAQKTVILVTHETTEAAVRKAVDGITKDGHLTDKPQVIRIERAGLKPFIGRGEAEALARRPDGEPPRSAGTNRAGAVLFGSNQRNPLNGRYQQIRPP